jgi:hypothetical protein
MFNERRGGASSGEGRRERGRGEDAGSPALPRRHPFMTREESEELMSDDECGDGGGR